MSYLALLTFIISLPTVYLLLTYYYLPDHYGKPDLVSPYQGVDEPYQICVDSVYVYQHSLSPLPLNVRMMIDDEIVPLSDIHVNIYHHIPHWMDTTFPEFDMVCTTQPELSIGTHEVIIFSNINFQWVPWRWKWMIHVDEDGIIT